MNLLQCFLHPFLQLLLLHVSIGDCLEARQDLDIPVLGLSKRVMTVVMTLAVPGMNVILSFDGSSGSAVKTHCLCY
jgi:hypothetical protein